MARATSADTTPRLISQSKKVSPASPDQRVPSQSKAATRGLRFKTDSRNCSPVGWMVPVLVIFMHFEHNVSRGKCAISLVLEALFCHSESSVAAQRGEDGEESAVRSAQHL